MCPLMRGKGMFVTLIRTILKKNSIRTDKLVGTRTRLTCGSGLGQTYYWSASVLLAGTGERTALISWRPLVASAAVLPARRGPHRRRPQSQAGQDSAGRLSLPALQTVGPSLPPSPRSTHVPLPVSAFLPARSTIKENEKIPCMIRKIVAHVLYVIEN
jgi:hypothetical protein